MRRLLLIPLAAAAFTVAPAAARAPSGLTEYGRVVWNLDALLHDTFGNRPVYVNYAASSAPPIGTFSTRFIAEAASRSYTYTFATARGSAFRIRRPSSPPKPKIGGAGWQMPLKIRGGYIYCGANRWLFEHGGQGPANWLLSCLR